MEYTHQRFTGCVYCFQILRQPAQGAAGARARRLREGLLGLHRVNTPPCPTPVASHPAISLAPLMTAR